MNPLTGYDSCRSIVINHSDDSALTAYQMKLTITNTKNLNWPYDVRFTEADGVTLLSFWREEYDATDGTWWVKINSIPAHPNDATIYVHVGDADAADVSSGADTFPFFDHFDVDLSKWSGDTSYFSVADSILTFSDTVYSSRYLWGNTVVANDVRARIRASLPSAGNFSGVALGSAAGGYADTVAAWVYFGQPNSSVWVTLKDSLNNIWSNQAIGFDEYHTYDFCRILTDTDTARAFYDNVQVGTDQTNRVNTLDNTVRFTGRSPVGFLRADWCFLSKYTLNEPTWGAWGAWEPRPSTGLIIITRPKYKIEVRDSNGVLKWVL